MKRIPLTQNKFALVDDADYEMLNQYKWSATCWNNDSDTPDFYAQNGRLGTMHRFLTNAPQGMHVDHINHNTLDNRRENLRVVTPQENRMNRRPANRKRGRPVTTGGTPRWSLRLDPETRKLLDMLSDYHLRSRASVIKVLIHDAAKQLPAAQPKFISDKAPRAKRSKQHAAPTHAN